MGVIGSKQKEIVLQVKDDKADVKPLLLLKYELSCKLGFRRSLDEKSLK